MSQSDDFLSRWSRRKQQVAKEAASAKDQAETAEKIVASPTDAAEPAETEPLFDLSKLPSLDSIGPQSDVSLFMQPGVPASLSRAALRRAWSADPAVRDFIGLSENAWDFTKPETIEGFGPLLPTDDVKKLLANIIRDKDDAHEEAPATALQQPDTEVPEVSVASQEAEIDRDSGTGELGAEAQSEIAAHCTKSHPAAQQEAQPDEASGALRKSRHGGALPT
jgi:hypothetical protein